MESKVRLGRRSGGEVEILTPPTSTDLSASALPATAPTRGSPKGWTSSRTVDGSKTVSPQTWTVTILVRLFLLKVSDPPVGM